MFSSLFLGFSSFSGFSFFGFVRCLCVVCQVCLVVCCFKLVVEFSSFLNWLTSYTGTSLFHCLCHMNGLDI